MSDLEIIGTPISNYVRAVRMVCEEKGVAYSLIPVMPHSPEVDALHPSGLVPCIRHGNTHLFESKAIATYIDQVFAGPKLIPDNPVLAAQVEQWVSYCNTKVDRCIMREFVVPSLFGDKEDASVQKKITDSLETIEECCAVLDNAVSKTSHLVGNSFTYADCNVIPMLAALQSLPRGQDILAKFPNLTAYIAKHTSRESFKTTQAAPSS